MQLAAKRPSQVALVFAFVSIVTASLAMVPNLTAQGDKAKPRAEERDEKKKLLGEFMRQKLDATNLVLEGLLTEDFDMLTKGAKKLSEMSRAEKWRVSNDMMYRHHSEDFQSRVDKLIKASKDESVDAAALAYFDTTMSCIDCHKWVRRTLIAKTSDKPAAKPGAQ